LSTNAGGFLILTLAPPEEVAMNSRARECLDRATECVRLAEAENDDRVRLLLVNLASAWARAAAQEKVDGIQARC
jgi:hypothetical protein